MAQLMLSESSLWRYNLVWDKQRGCDFLNANVKPLKAHEEVAIFYKKDQPIISNIGILHRTRKLRVVLCLITMVIGVQLFQKVLREKDVL